MIHFELSFILLHVYIHLSMFISGLSFLFHWSIYASFCQYHTFPLSLSLFFFPLFFLWPHHTACGIFVSQPGLEPVLPGLEVQSLNQWTTRKGSTLFKWCQILPPNTILHARIWALKLDHEWASLVAQMVKHLPAMWESWVRSLGREDPPEKEMATHFSTLAWKIPWVEEPW